jgi:S-formylglutathione hydrolase FrmB
MWSEVEVSHHPVDVYEPPGLSAPALAVMFLHGVGLETLRDRPAFTRVFDALELLVCSPKTRRSWWTDRVCAEFDPCISAEQYLLQQVLPFMERRWGVKPPRIGLLGISMGGQGALRLAFKHAALFPVAAAISPAIDYHELYGQGSPLDDLYDSKEQCRQDTATMHVPPADYPPHLFFCIDPTDLAWYRGNDRLHEKLSALGVPHEHDLTTRAGGHSWEYFDYMAERAIRFVHQGLTSYRRRLL